MQKGKLERQEKRTENIKERTQAKIDKKLKHKVSVGLWGVGSSPALWISLNLMLAVCRIWFAQGPQNRAGFEGKKKEFLNE